MIARPDCGRRARHGLRIRAGAGPISRRRRVGAAGFNGTRRRGTRARWIARGRSARFFMIDRTARVRQARPDGAGDRSASAIEALGFFPPASRRSDVTAAPPHGGSKSCGAQLQSRRVAWHGARPSATSASADQRGDIDSAFGRGERPSAFTRSSGRVVFAALGYRGARKNVIRESRVLSPKRPWPAD